MKQSSTIGCAHRPSQFREVTIRSILLASAALTLLSAPAAAQLRPGQPPLTAQTKSSGGPLDPAQEKLRFDSADLAIEVLPESQSIKGVATLRFTAKAATTTLVIDLDRNLPISAVAIDGRPLASGAWSNPEGRVTITLDRSIAAGQKFSAKISYGGTPHVAVNAPWLGGFVWSKAPSGEPYVATAIQTYGCDLIWPCIDYPTYEPDYINLHITVPKGLKAPANGVLKGVDTLSDGRTTWHWHVKQPTIYGIALNVGPYKEISARYKSRFGNEIPLHYWHLSSPERDVKAAKLFAEFAPTLDFFESMIGPYPFADEKLGVVETPHKGMEHQTINAYGNDYAKTQWGYDDLFQHELAHEWFANQLTVPNWDDFWLHEGTGTYMQPLYGEWRSGKATYIAMLLESRPNIHNRAPIVSGKPQSAEEVYADGSGRGSDIYVKGSWVLHTLRGLIGDKAFFDALRLSVYGRTDPKPGNFKSLYRTTPEFIAFVNQTSGRNLQWFFDIYLYEAALPELVQERVGNTLTLRWKAPANKPFPMPVELQIDGKLQTVEMPGGAATLTVPATAHIVVDPMSKILKHEADTEAYREWRASMIRRPR